MSVACLDQFKLEEKSLPRQKVRVEQSSTFLALELFVAQTFYLTNPSHGCLQQSPQDANTLTRPIFNVIYVTTRILGRYAPLILVIFLKYL